MDKNNQKFSEKHPKLNMLISLFIVFATLAFLACCAYLIIILIHNGVNFFIDWLKNLTSTLDTVIVVALITGLVSIIGVIFTSIIAKVIDAKHKRRDYLTHKREIPYGEFVDMVYKLQMSKKSVHKYTQEEMLDDISKFSRQITLWGSPKVVDKWVKFRENGLNPKAAIDNLFLLEDIMNEMRKDLGLKKVNKGNLLAFFINDIKQTMSKK